MFVNKFLALTVSPGGEYSTLYTVHSYTDAEGSQLDISNSVCLTGESLMKEKMSKEISPTKGFSFISPVSKLADISGNHQFGKLASLGKPK